MKKLEFCEKFVCLNKKPISFAGRPYLIEPYSATTRRLVIRASRQVEKSTFLVTTISHAAVLRPGVHILFVCPRQEQAQVFSRSRLLRTIVGSPLIRRVLVGRKVRQLQVMHLAFQNDSEVYIRADYHSADAARGIDADLLLVDEFQDIADGHLPALEETRSHSDLRQVVLTGTPKTMDDHYRFVVVRWDRFWSQEDPDQVLQQVAQRCQQFGIKIIAADGGGNGHVYNRLLITRHRGPCAFFAIMYSASEHEPRQEGLLWRWTVNRSASIGTVVGRVKKGSMVFPRVEDCGSFLAELACEVAEYDDQNQSITYSHPETQPDDCLHATTYALPVAIREHGHRQMYGDAKNL